MSDDVKHKNRRGRYAVRDDDVMVKQYRCPNQRGCQNQNMIQHSGCDL